MQQIPPSLCNLHCVLRVCTSAPVHRWRLQYSVYDGRVGLVNGAVVSVTGTRCCYMWDLHNHVHHRFDLLYFLEPGCTIFTNTYQRAACRKVSFKKK